MALTEDDLKALRSLMREEINEAFEQRFEPFRTEVNERFDDLYAQNEKREQEYLAMSEQLGRHDKQLGSISEQLDRIEKKVDRHDQYFDDLDARVAVLEKKRA